MLKPVEKPIKFIKNLSTKGKSYPITHVSAVIDDNGESVKSTIDSLKNKGSLTKVTWLELKDKRDAGKLIPGSLYKITDYQCTTTQEGTQSAGHQFDIVLLALSENKLAEEGWAMMHIDNIYKVVFDDNEVVSCYITPIANHPDRYYIVNVDTLLGSDMSITPDRIDEDNKIITLTSGWTPDVLVDPDLPYNYFQNSNLSAWKVWYCLDNDTARFAWADDSLDEDVTATLMDDSNVLYTRNQEQDFTDLGHKGYAWIRETDSRIYYTLSEQPQVDDWLEDVYNEQANKITAVTPAHEGTYHPEYIETIEDEETIRWTYTGTFVINNANFKCWANNLDENIYTDVMETEVGGKTFSLSNENPLHPPRLVDREIPISNYQPEHLAYNGRGVIYRLIDEWNNDIKYDFKNIQFKRKLTDGSYDANGTETWCYTLNAWYNDMCQDASIVGNTLPNYWNYISGVYDNVFGYATAMDLFIEGVNTFAFVLGNNVVLSFDNRGTYSGIYSNTIGNSFYSNTIGDNFNNNIIGNYFSNNTIGNGFAVNIIRNGFGNNTIGNDFYGNTIGNDFQNKNISTQLSYANYGNNGVELATKDDIGNIETALNNI